MTIRDRGSGLQRRHRAQHAQASPRRRGARTDSLHRVGEPARMARQRTDERVEVHQQRGARRPHALGVTGEHAQPPPHRRVRPAKTLGDRSMPRAGRLQPQRGTDHVHPVSPSHQARHGQQHMRDLAPDAASAARPQHPDTAHHPPPSVPPRRQTATTRASQLTRAQPPFDLNRVGTYHDHGCLQCTKERPSRPAKEWEGRCASPTCSGCRRTRQGATHGRPLRSSSR